ncbi:MAG: hypothetical protein QM803_12960 [Rhodocyclaceae bacterium]
MSSSPLPQRVRLAAGDRCELSVKAGALVVAEGASVIVDAGTRWLDGIGLPSRQRIESGAAYTSHEGGWLCVEAGAQGADIVVVLPPSGIAAAMARLQSLRAALIRALYAARGRHLHAE